MLCVPSGVQGVGQRAGASGGQHGCRNTKSYVALSTQEEDVPFGAAQDAKECVFNAGQQWAVHLQTARATASVR